MKGITKKLFSMFLILVLSMALCAGTVSAEEETNPAVNQQQSEEISGETQNNEESADDGEEKNENEEGEVEEETEEESTEAEPALITPLMAEAAGPVSGTFDQIEGYELATVRYFTNAEKTEYAFASFTYNSGSEKYEYNFTAPYAGFNAVQGTQQSTGEVDENATVIAYYYNLNKWDGAVDVSWYNETDTDFYLYTPAQLAGLAAVVNGSIDGTTYDYEVKGYRSDLSSALPDCIESTFFENVSLPGGHTDDVYKGSMEHDFANRTIHIMADMDMGGVDGSQIEMADYDIGADNPNSNWNRNLHEDEYPNWTPIGGEYLMDVADNDTMIIAFFNGTIEGHGHSIDNIYCYRWSYRSTGDTAYAYCQGIGLVGDMGTLYDDNRGKEENPTVMPGIKNLAISGFIYGRRMVGGFVGCLGGGSNAADGTSVPGGIVLENLANHAYVYCTDSKGLGGIVGCSMSSGSIINCYNTGYLSANYAAPSGGIVGSNEGMDIFCCYNIGTVNTNTNKYGRGIGADGSGSNYTVDNCYYLEGSGDDPDYPGYRTYNLAPSVSVNVTELTETKMKDGTMLAGLNANGTAYVQGDDGWPVLYWEKNSGDGNLSLSQPTGGSVSAVSTGTIANGTVVYLTNTVETGWNFRYYTLNGEKLSGDYVTVNGNCAVSAFLESVKAGVLKIADNNICNITVLKNGTIMSEGGAQTVSNYPVNAGDSIYEGDQLIVTATIKDGQAPEDTDLVYSAQAGLATPFEYEFTYTGGTTKSTTVQTYVVTSDINGEDVSLTLNVVPKTTQKLWKYVADTSWYDENVSEVILTKPEQLAGLEVLVNSGITFEGKTVKLGNDISLANNDGTDGKRFWDGIGTSTNKFKGIFDGCNHTITDMHSNSAALFNMVSGTSTTDRAVIKNITIYGDATGANASGLVANAANTDISYCDTYVAVAGTSGKSGGVVGYVTSSTNISNCNSYGNISGYGAVGGIVGELSAGSAVTDCINKGDVSCTYDCGASVGGVVGSLNGELLRTANYGNVTACGRNIGGVAGQSVSGKSSIIDCYNVGTVKIENSSNQYDSIGGIVGFGSFYKISNSFNYGKVVSSGIKSSNVGGIIGRDGARSSNVTSNVYMLDSSCDYVEAMTKAEELPEATYVTGMKVATAAQFKSSDGVLTAINGNSAFAVKGNYPEFGTAEQTHVHSGGTATCCRKAVCEVCGLEYGLLDPDNHISTVIRNKKDAVWTTDGYTGDICCRDCHEVVEAGSVITADTSATAIKINVVQGEKTVNTKSYTIAQFDALKSTTPIGYSYGSKSTEIVATTEYVTLDTILSQFSMELADIEKIVVVCSGSKSTITADTLKNCNKYYESGTESAAPAAFCISWATQSGTLEQVAAICTQKSTIRFGYGISKEQHDSNESLGGARLVSPVTEVNIYIPESEEYELGDVDLNGVVNANDITALARHVYSVKELKNADSLRVADVDKNGTIDANDVTRLARYVYGVISNL